MPSLADLISEGDFAKGLDRPSGNPFGRWAQGVAQRTLHPLETLATVAQESIDDPMATALSWANPMSATGNSLASLAGIFAGKGAKTADIVKLSLAQKLKSQGIPDEQIWKETGWTSGFPDGKWRFEIPDNAAMFKKYGIKDLSTYGARKQQTIFEHDPLYSAYPDTADIVALRARGNNYGGYLSKSPDGSVDNIGLQYPNKKIEMEELLGTNLHELQHAIQQREGFARGGSPDEILSELKITAPELYASYERTGELGKLGFNRYKRLAGEAEARLTQARMNMTPEQRLANYPVSQFDVPVQDQIVRYGEGGNMAAMDNPNTVTLYHGTDEKAAKEISKRGFRGNYTYLTPDIAAAKRYGGENGVVIEVNVPKDKLLIDHDLGSDDMLLNIKSANNHNDHNDWTIDDWLENHGSFAIKNE